MRITRRKLRSLIESVIRESTQDALSSVKLDVAYRKKIMQFLEDNIDDYVEGKYPELLNLGYASPMNIVNVSFAGPGPEGDIYRRGTGGEKTGFANIDQDLVYDVNIRLRDLKDGRGRILLDDRDVPKFLEELSEEIDGLTLKLAEGSVSFDTIKKAYNDHSNKELAELFLQVAVKYYKIRR